MKKKLAFVVGVAAGVASMLVPATGSTQAAVLPEAVPPACVVVDAPPVHVQLGYAPNGPSDCTALPA